MQKATIYPVKIVSAESMAGDITSAPTNIHQQDNLVYQINVLTGTPVGVLNVETSSDYNPITSNTGNWTAIGSTFQSTVNGTGTGVFDINQLGPVWVRLKYTRTSGTGTMDVYVSAKQV